MPRPAVRPSVPLATASNNTYGVLIAQGAAIQSDGTNKHGNSNGGVQAPNASFGRHSYPE